MKKAVIIILLFSVNLALAQSKKWTLEEAVAHALENNISIKQTELDVQLAEIQKKEAIGNMLPTLNGSASYSSNTGSNINPVTNSFENTTFQSFTTGAQTGITIFSGLQNLRQLQKAKMQQVAAQYNLDKMKDDIALNVANAYLQVLFNKENLKNVQAQKQITQEQLDRANQLVDAGVIPRGDLLEIKATLASDEQRMVVGQNQIDIALINLAQLLLIKEYETFDIAESDYEVPLTTITELSVKEIIAKAKESRPELKIANQNLSLAQKDLQIARGAYYPRLNGFAGYDTRWADNDFFDRDFRTQLYENDGTFYGVQLQVPIFNGLAARNNVKRTKINIERAEIQKEQTDLELESNVYRAYNDVKGAFSAYQAALQADEAQNLAHEFSEERFREGFINSFEVSQAKVRLENAQSEVLRTKYDYIFKLKVLELYFGIPLY